MTLKDFDAELKRAFPDTYETAAPKGKHRYVVWTRYGRSPIFGDNRNQLEAPKIQLDIVTNIPDDPLFDDICAALWLMDIPYSIQSDGYDDEFNAFRTVLQMVVT